MSDSILEEFSDLMNVFVYFFISTNLYIFSTSCDWVTMSLGKILHKNCINNVYPFGEIKRFPLTNEEIPWSYVFSSYNPPEYSSKGLLNKPWADPPIGKSLNLH